MFTFWKKIVLFKRPFKMVDTWNVSTELYYAYILQEIKDCLEKLLCVWHMTCCFLYTIKSYSCWRRRPLLDGRCIFTLIKNHSCISYVFTVRPNKTHLPFSLEEIMWSILSLKILWFLVKPLYRWLFDLINIVFWPRACRVVGEIG